MSDLDLSGIKVGDMVWVYAYAGSPPVQQKVTAVRKTWFTVESGNFNKKHGISTERKTGQWHSHTKCIVSPAEAAGIITRIETKNRTRSVIHKIEDYTAAIRSAGLNSSRVNALRVELDKAEALLRDAGEWSDAP